MRLLAYSQTEKPSREKLATELKGLADKVAAGGSPAVRKSLEIVFNKGTKLKTKETAETLASIAQRNFKVVINDVNSFVEKLLRRVDSKEMVFDSMREPLESLADTLAIAVESAGKCVSVGSKETYDAFFNKNP
jgi:uncharacterized membrane protein YvbJ